LGGEANRMKIRAVVGAVFLAISSTATNVAPDLDMALPSKVTIP